jgi:hypothetical protein
VALRLASERMEALSAAEQRRTAYLSGERPD